MQTIAAAIPGIENLLQILGRGNERFVVRQRTMPQVVDGAHLGVRSHQALGQLGQLLFKSKVGRHRQDSRRETTRAEKNSPNEGNAFALEGRRCPGYAGHVQRHTQRRDARFGSECIGKFPVTCLIA